MFTKLLAIVIILGITACMLLVNRQQRIEAAHEMTVIHQRLTDHDRTIWKLRAEVARRCSPDQLHRLRDELGGDWHPLLRESPAAWFDAWFNQFEQDRFEEHEDEQHWGG